MIYAIHTGSYSDRGIRCIVSSDREMFEAEVEQANTIAIKAFDMWSARWSAHREVWFQFHEVDSQSQNYYSTLADGTRWSGWEYYYTYLKGYNEEFPDSVRYPDYFGQEMERLGATVLEYEEIDLD